jgi:hypothetical protein
MFLRIPLSSCLILGKQLSIHPPPEEQRLQLLNEVWKVVTKSTDIVGYVRCSYAWLDLVQKYYSEREMYVLLGNLSLRLEEVYATDTRIEVHILTSARTHIVLLFY